MRKQTAIVLAMLGWVLSGMVFPSSALAQQSKPAEPASQNEDAVIPGDWAPELLDAILSSQSEGARDDLLNATFAAGPVVTPQLEAALKDDRTAEFAAQSLAFIGGSRALDILQKLVADPRDLDLRRFSYGALGEFETPQATQILLDVIARSDSEPDRTVTGAAIVALTVHADENLIPSLKQVQAKVTDVVIHDDLENAMEVIRSRAKYLATPEGKHAGDSIESAVRTYFISALEPPPTNPSGPSQHLVKDPKTGKMIAKPAAPLKPTASVGIPRLTFSPDKTRALARVVFEDPTARASYDMVLQKEFGDWKIASIWVGEEEEKAPVVPGPNSSPEKQE